MRKGQKFRRATRQKALEMFAKSLATKLAILLHSKRAPAKTSRSSSVAEMSLFGADGLRKYLTPAERVRFQGAIQNLESDRRLFCAVLLWSGGRVSEVLSLTPSKIDLDSGAVVFLTLKRRRQIFRQVPLPIELLNELAERYDLENEQKHPVRRQSRLWPWSRTTSWRIIKSVMKAASVNSLAASPKGLRHTFGTSAFLAQVPPHLVQRWLGHASLRTTSIYGEVIGAEERSIANRIWQGK